MTNHKVDPYRQNVLRLIETAGLDLATASRQLGRNHAYLQQFIKRGTPRYLPEVVRDRLADLLGISSVELKPDTIDSAVVPAGRSPAAMSAVAIDDNVVMTIALAALRATGVKFTGVQESRAITEAANIRDRIAAGTPVEIIKAELA